MKVKFRLSLVPQPKVVDDVESCHGVKSHRRSCRYAHSDTGFGFPGIKLVGVDILRLFVGTAICFSSFSQPSLHRMASYCVHWSIWYRRTLTSMTDYVLPLECTHLWEVEKKVQKNQQLSYFILPTSEHCHINVHYSDFTYLHTSSIVTIHRQQQRRHKTW